MGVADKGTFENLAVVLWLIYRTLPDHQVHIFALERVAQV
jgi:hypothetical protein